MFCPLCKTEYREGFYTCADCSVSLVEALPQIEEIQPEIHQPTEFYSGEFIEVFQTADQSDILTVKLTFDEEKIPNNFSGDFLLGDRPGRIARFFVPTEFAQRAIEILRKLNPAAEPGRDCHGG